MAFVPAGQVQGDFFSIPPPGPERLDLLHEGGELVGVQGLGPVGEGLFRFVMDLDHEAVGPGGHRGPGQGRHQVAAAGGVAGVDDDGQVGLPVHRRHRGQVQEIPGVLADAPIPARTG